MADADPQLELKKRARRRLVGAIALAVLAAIILPIVMDKEPRTQRSDIVVRIPSQEGANFTTQPIQGGETSTVQASPKPTPDASAPKAVSVPQASSSSPVEVPAESARAEGQPGDRTSVEALPAPSKAVSAVHTEDGQRAAELLGETTKTDHASYIVQLGVFKDTANAQAVRSTAKGAGIATYAEPAGKATRVRAGPYASREAADKAMARLHKAGLQAVVQARP